MKCSLIFASANAQPADGWQATGDVQTVNARARLICMPQPDPEGARWAVQDEDRIVAHQRRWLDLSARAEPLKEFIEMRLELLAFDGYAAFVDLGWRQLNRRC